MIRNQLKRIARHLPLLGRFFRELDAWRSQTYVPPGHFYSPVPSIKEVLQDGEKVFDRSAKALPGIELNESAQLELLERLADYYPQLPFGPTKKPNLRYYLENANYGWSDGIFLFCMLRHLRPKRIIEVGSGFSSCLMLDVNELFFDNSIRCTFIDPYPDHLFSLISHKDRERNRILPSRLQDVETALFQELEAGDLLFVDSTHVSKVNSDVNHLLFKILPALKPGVFIHIHDIHFPFEYPKEWVIQGIAWNEAYILRAFLQFNTTFQIRLFNTYLFEHHKEQLLKWLPAADRSMGSIWLEKTA